MTSDSCGEKIMIRENKFTIGRSRKCDIVLADDSVSRVHAELICLKDGALFVTDCHSRNGTALIRNSREKAVRQEFLSKDDILRFGDVEMPVRELSEAVSGKLKSFDINSIPDIIPESPPKPWVRGERLIRCDCGAVKPKKGSCQECGQ